MTDYIEIRNWDKFQHADATKRGNDPVWIKAYTRLLSDDDYLGLTGHRRAILHGLWLEYARSGRRLRLDTAFLTRRLDLRVSMADLNAIKNLGFIEIRQDSVKTVSSLDKKRREVLPTEGRTRPRDELWEALENAVGRAPATSIERKRWNAALKELRDAGATPAEIIGRAGAYRREWPDVELTPHGLASNWSRFEAARVETLKPFACECGVRFKSEARLVEHRENVHGEWRSNVG